MEQKTQKRAETTAQPSTGLGAKLYEWSLLVVPAAAIVWVVINLAKENGGLQLLAAFVLFAAIVVLIAYVAAHFCPAEEKTKKNRRNEMLGGDRETASDSDEDRADRD